MKTKQQIISKLLIEEIGSTNCSICEHDPTAYNENCDDCNGDDKNKWTLSQEFSMKLAETILVKLVRIEYEKNGYKRGF
jgi:hypothetical protein